MVFMVIAIAQLSDEDTKKEVDSYLKRITEHVKKNEPNTLQYLVGVKQDDPLCLIITEIYKTKDDFETIHMTSDLLKEWMAFADEKIKAGLLEITPAIGPSVDSLGFLQR